MSIHRVLVLLLCASLFGSIPARVVTAEEYAGDANELVDLEDLIFMEVTSVSKKAQRLTESAAAIYVVTQDDIRRSGVTSIAEALRMVPGLQVARSATGTYAITSRGLNGIFADKLLVLMDGRSVYTPTFGGVFWDIQDAVLEDIDRIEVIRGPGATMWGANAVNGVINIISKQARDTQGGLLVAGGGTLDRAFTTVRYGGEGSGGDLHYRVYGKARQSGPMEELDGSDAHDQQTDGRFGFRMDWDASDRDSVTFQGDAYVGDYEVVYEGIPALDQPTTSWDSEWDAKGFNLIGRWTRNVSDTNYFTLQSYFDKNDRESVAVGIERNTFDIEFQQGLHWGSINEFVWGAGYRVTADEMDNSVSLGFDPDARTVNFYNLFAQNETRLVDEKLRLTLGAKVEYNDFVGGGVEPSARLLYMISQNQSVWGAVSRALQMGSRLEDVRVTRMQFEMVPQINGMLVGDDDNFDSQELLAFELGYRVMPVERLSLDITGFYNEYDKLVAIEDGLLEGPFFYPDASNPTAIIYAVPLQTNISGWTAGVEVAAQWQVMDHWRLAGSYSYLEVEMDPDSTTGTVDGENGNHPTSQWNVRSLVDLPADLQWDTMLYYMDELSSRGIDSYYRLDLRLGWKPLENLDLSLVGQNLLDDQHQEWPGEYGFTGSYVPRSVYGKVTWEF